MGSVAWLLASKIVWVTIRIAVLFHVYTWPNTSYLVACKLTGRMLSGCSVAIREEACLRAAALLPDIACYQFAHGQTICS